ncbi:hypothetical protein [Chryseobacterium sp.]|uniref:hypothetical protein n=1 Tax=Chryseobacterium sp. TaxID=1871047 RepID=UPI0011CBEE98|nr:hypothetical protein [Chryseobacterium sp.]TXF77783.1 hypothetical protein FUA25_07625 [Chryseobacterium sp.]
MGTKIDYSNITQQPKEELKSVRKALRSKDYHNVESEKDLKKALRDPLNHYMQITNNGVFAINKLKYKRNNFLLLEGNPVTYYFSVAYDVLPQIAEARIFLLDSFKREQSEFKWKSSTAFSYIFKVGSMGTLFSFLALESFMNQCLPDFAKVLYKGKLVDKMVIQRRLTFEDKFKIIIPTVTGKDFVADHPRKAEIIVNIKKLRDDLTHLKEDRKNGFSAYEEINNKILNLDLKKVVNTVKFYINYHKPKTIQNYREKHAKRKLKIIKQTWGEDEGGRFVKQYYKEEFKDIICTRF